MGRANDRIELRRYSITGKLLERVVIGFDGGALIEELNRPEKQDEIYHVPGGLESMDCPLCSILKPKSVADSSPTPKRLGLAQRLKSTRLWKLALDTMALAKMTLRLLFP